MFQFRRTEAADMVVVDTEVADMVVAEAECAAAVVVAECTSALLALRLQLPA